MRKTVLRLKVCDSVAEVELFFQTINYKDLIDIKIASSSTVFQRYFIIYKEKINTKEKQKPKPTLKHY